MTDPVVSIRHLGKTIGARTILRDISVDVAAGNVVGVLGKNGAGKTTLLDILLGYSPATAGTATLFGAESLRLPPATKRRIGFVPQEDELVDSLTGAQLLSLTASLHGSWDRGLIERLIGEWEIPLERTIRKLSGGERQKLSTLLALGHRPDLIVLDEPASNLDPIARRRLLQQILEIAESPSRTVIFSTHAVADLERVANQVWIVREGTIAWQGDLDALKESFARLQIRCRNALPAALGIPNTVSERVDGRNAEIVVSGWDETGHEELARRLAAEIRVEGLSLEDIFLELHR